MKTDIYSYSDIGGREKNEDTFGAWEYPGCICAVVADGLGAHGNGKDASRIAVQEMQKLGNNSTIPSEAEIIRAINNANNIIISSRKSQYNMKTTLVSLYANETNAVWVHVGDSRLYHFYNYRLKDYTLDHSVPQMAVALGEIERKDIPTHRERNKVLRVVGSEEVSPEIKAIKLDSGQHAFLLCTDGFWEYLQEDEIFLDLAKSRNPKEWINNLRCRIMRRIDSNQDNNTAVAVWVEV